MVGRLIGWIGGAARASADPRYRAASMATARLKLRRTLVAGTLTAVALGVASGCAGDGDETDVAAGEEASIEESAVLSGVRFDARRDPGCGCCTSWVEYMRDHGATVELSEDEDRTSFRTQHGITDEAASCHTAVVDGYAIEGHVPVGAIQRLLADRPDAVGLALPGMPVASPGMGGDVSSWERQPVMLIGRDGGLTAFEY